MRKKKWIFVAAPVGILIVMAIGGSVVLYLWNWLAPALVGLRQISFWEALGLLALCRILFGGFGLGGGSHRSHMRRRMDERWDQMTPEEREKFRQWLQDRSTGPTPDPKPTV